MQTANATQSLMGRLNWQNILSAPAVWLCLLVVSVFALLVLVASPATLFSSLGDTDDATRLVQVRALLNGGAWYDPILAQFGGPYPYVSHWSRLIDLPLYLLISFFSLFMSAQSAEVAARFVWPLMTLWALLTVAVKISEARAGRTAGLFALAFLGLNPFIFMQFSPGRIDHHNVQILGAAGGILLLMQSYKDPRFGWAAGAVFALGLAVGYEALPLTALALAVAGLGAVLGYGSAGIMRAASAFAGGLAAAFVLTVAPSRWLEITCDTLSLNIVLLALACVAGLILTLRIGERAAIPVRLLITGGFTSLGLILYGALEPACLAGPFGAIDPALGPIWLNHVFETQSILHMLASMPDLTIGTLVYLTAGAYAAIALARKEKDNGTIFLAVVLCLSIILGCWQLKLLPYPAVLAAVPLAIAISRIEGSKSATKQQWRIRAFALSNPMTWIGLVSVLIGLTAPGPSAIAKSKASAAACYQNNALAPLAELTPGLAVAEVDLGPYLAASTRLDVLAGPYHRLDRSILENHAVFFAEPAEAERRLRALDATYVITCPGIYGTIAKGKVPETALRPSLLAGRTLPFLEPVTLAGPTPIKVWRVRPN